MQKRKSCCILVEVGDYSIKCNGPEEPSSNIGFSERSISSLRIFGLGEELFFNNSIVKYPDFQQRLPDAT